MQHVQHIPVLYFQRAIMSLITVVTAQNNALLFEQVRFTSVTVTTATSADSGLPVPFYRATPC